jgi:hypothetical protein
VQDRIRNYLFHLKNGSSFEIEVAYRELTTLIRSNVEQATFCIPELLKLLVNKEDMVSQVMLLLADAKTVSENEVDEVIELLKNEPDPLVLKYSIRSLAKEKAWKAYSSVIPFIQHQEPEVRNAALHTLPHLGQIDDSLTPYLNDIFSHMKESRIYRLTGLKFLSFFKSNDYQTLQKITSEVSPLLTSEDYTTKLETIRVFNRIGVIEKKVLEQIIILLLIDEDKWIRLACANIVTKDAYFNNPGFRDNIITAWTTLLEKENDNTIKHTIKLAMKRCLQGE